MTLFLFIMGIIFLIAAIIALSMKNNRKIKSPQEMSFLFLLLSIAFFGIAIATYIFAYKSCKKVPTTYIAPFSHHLFSTQN